MRIPVLALPLLLLTLPAQAAGPQVTDPAGDALLAEHDIVSVAWSADATTQRVAVTFANATRAASVRYVLRFATPVCATASWTWATGLDTSAVSVCGARAWFAPPVVAGRTVTFAAPLASLPGRLAPGTVLSRLGADSAPYVDVVVGALYPNADSANSDARYAVGS